MCTDGIIPYVGAGSIALYQTLEEVRLALRGMGVRYHEEVWGSKGETVPNPWTVVKVDDVLTLFFAKNNKLFKMMLWKGYQGSLPNGIHTGMPLEEALRVDPGLVFDDWNEIYMSPLGYWLEDDLDTGEVDSISIYIRELLDEERFDECEW